MQKFRFNVGGRWAGEPWEPQFSVEAGQEVSVGSRVTVGKDGSVLTVSEKLAMSAYRKGRGQFIVEKEGTSFGKTGIQAETGPVVKAEAPTPVKKPEQRFKGNHRR